MCKRVSLVVLALVFCIGPMVHAANIILVAENRDADGNGIQDDLGLEDFLKGLGHQVDVRRGNWTTLDAGKIAELNAADLVIVSRSTSSGNYDDDTTEITSWNSLTSPMMLHSSYLSRGTSSGYRWYWLNSSTISNLVGPRMQVVEPTHPIFKGIPLDASNQVDVVDGTTGTGQTSFAGTTDVGNGKLLATTATGTNAWIAEWEPGVPYYTGSPGTPGGKRMLFCVGTQESGATPQGAFNLTDNGKQLLINAVNYLLGVTTQTTASSPVPAHEATDVARDVVLGWTPSETAATHNVYFGTSADDVDNADTTSPLGVLVSPGQDANSYDPDGVLEFGRTYHWRIDEVNAAPDFAVVKGEVWSFTVEPVSYPIQNIQATASSFTENMGPEKTVDGSGLDAADQHSTTETQMWLSADGGPQPTWIQYEFDKAYKLDRLVVWNSNQTLESILGLGARSVTVEYSADGITWTALGDFEFARAPGQATYAADIAVDFADAVARYVKLTINSNWGELLAQYGLSELRFFYTPVVAREPMPVSGQTDVEVDTVLSWRSGREAASHQVSFDIDQQAVIDGTAPVQTLSQNRFDPGALSLGTTYFWKVTEVNDAETPAVWPGDLWSFSTREYLVVDDFESYNDEQGMDTRIYETWIDGWAAATKNGATVGNWDPPFAEQTIVHGGKQSMPMDYNNTDSPFCSEAYREFAPVQDWTVNGADTLSLWVRGNPISFLESTLGSITIGGGGADIWGTADEFRFAFKNLNNDGSIVARIDSLGNSDPWAKAGLMIRESLDPGAKNAMAYVTADGRVGWQFRLLVAGTSDSTRSDPGTITLPHWLRLTRTGSTIQAEHSSDGTTWEPMIEVANPTEPTARDLTMGSTVYIGLAVTSHNANVMTTAEFSNISTTGTVAGAWQVRELGVSQPVNDPATLYAMVQDSAGKTATATNPTLVTAGAWTEWRIPLSDFAGVNLSKVKRLYLGVGGRANPTQGGAGRIYIDDIGFGKPLASE